MDLSTLQTYNNLKISCFVLEGGGGVKNWCSKNYGKTSTSKFFFSKNLHEYHFIISTFMLLPTLLYFKSLGQIDDNSIILPWLGVQARSMRKYVLLIFNSLGYKVSIVFIRKIILFKVINFVQHSHSFDCLHL